MKYFILLFVLADALLAAPGDEMDRLIFPDGRDRHGVLKIDGEDQSQKLLVESYTGARTGGKDGLNQWLEKFPLLTKQLPTLEFCKTIIDGYESATSKSEQYAPSERRCADPDWLKNGAQQYVNALSQIIQAACHFYPPALHDLQVWFLYALNKKTPYNIKEDPTRYALYDYIHDHSQQIVCGSAPEHQCLACQWGMMYKQAKAPAESAAASLPFGSEPGPIAVVRRASEQSEEETRFRNRLFGCSSLSAALSDICAPRRFLPAVATDRAATGDDLPSSKFVILSKGSDVSLRHRTTARTFIP